MAELQESRIALFEKLFELLDEEILNETSQSDSYLDEAEIQKRIIEGLLGIAQYSKALILKAIQDMAIHEAQVNNKCNPHRVQEYLEYEEYLNGEEDEIKKQVAKIEKQVEGKKAGQLFNGVNDAPITEQCEEKSENKEESENTLTKLWKAIQSIFGKIFGFMASIAIVIGEKIKSATENRNEIEEDCSSQREPFRIIEKPPITNSEYIRQQQANSQPSMSYSKE